MLAVFLLAAAVTADDAGLLLRHRFAVGDELRYEVVNESTIDMSRGEETQSVSHGSDSIKRYTVVAAEDAAATLELRIEHVVMTAADHEGQPITFDSRGGGVPLEFSGIAGTIGPVVARIRVDDRGQVIDVVDTLKLGTEAGQFDQSNHHTLVPLPEEPVEVGSHWKQAFEVRIQSAPESKTTIPIKLLRTYTVDAIDGDQVMIGWRVRPLTPIGDPFIESNIAHRLLSGRIVFDVAAGRVVERSGRIESEIVGFSGPATLMKKVVVVSENLVGQHK